MSTIAQIVAGLSAAPRPVLFLDTCALLDIIRAPLRDRAPTVQASVELRASVANGSIQLLVSDLVPREWADNLEAVRRDGESGVRAFLATWRIALDLGLPAPSAPVIGPGNLIDDLVQLSRDLLDVSETVDRDHLGMSWAIDRVANKRKPSKQGAVKDCHILGHSLALSASLANAGHLKSRIFVSSNTSDFADPIATTFHPDIAYDAALAGLRYATSLEASVIQLRQGGEIP